MLIYRVDNIGDDLKLFLHSVHAICEVINSPRSLAVSLCLQYQEWEEYVSLPLEPSLYEHPRRFAEDRLVTEVLRKCELLPLEIDRKAVALESFKDSEVCCKVTNSRLKTETPVWFFQYQRQISDLLGPLCRADLDYVVKKARFGPGSTTGVRGEGSSSSFKFDKRLHLTSELIPFTRSLMGELWWKHQSSWKEVVKGNKFTSVPKSWKTERGICVEPTLNIFLQLGIGSLLRKRLQRKGLNLNSQDRNRKMAELAYTRKYATIDLSSASDSVSRELIVQYFPSDWVELLALPRSAFCTLPNGEVIELEKWSSMGNGYTFELETLCFYALCKTIIPKKDHHDIAVYGDDIIVPQKHASAVIEALNFLGFKVNTSKSFLAGSFFESCGHDYFKGVNVRPFYLKHREENIPTCVQIANRLRLWCRQLNLENSCDSRFKTVWNDIKRRAPRVWRKTIVPIHAGDSGFIQEIGGSRVERDGQGWEGWYYPCIILEPKMRRTGTLGVLLSAYARAGNRESDTEMYSVIDSTEALFTKGREPIRGYLGKPRTKRTFTSYWSGGLEWDTW